MKNIEEIQWKLKITININRQSTEQFELSGLDIFNVKLFMLIFYYCLSYDFQSNL